MTFQNIDYFQNCIFCIFQQPVEQQYIIQQAEPTPVQQHEIQTDFRQQQHVPQQQQIFYATPVSEESRIITNMEPQQQVQQGQQQVSYFSNHNAQITLI